MESGGDPSKYDNVGEGETGNVGTHYEQLIAKLMESGGDPSKYDNVCGWRGWDW